MRSYPLGSGGGGRQSGLWRSADTRKKFSEGLGLMAKWDRPMGDTVQLQHQHMRDCEQQGGPEWERMGASAL